jgi:hypothetical protein
MDIKLCIKNLIQELESFISIVNSIIIEGKSKSLDTENAVKWQLNLSLWLERLKQFESSTNDPIFDLKAFGWAHHFSNLAHFFGGSFPWSSHDSEYDLQFNKLYDTANILASSRDVRTLPLEAAPPVN